MNILQKKVTFMNILYIYYEIVHKVHNKKKMKKDKEKIKTQNKNI